MTAQSHSPSPRKPSRILRVAGWALLALVMAVAFAGYLGADLQMQWENIAALCGF